MKWCGSMTRGAKDREPIIHPHVITKWDFGRVREIPSAVSATCHHGIIKKNGIYISDMGFKYWRRGRARMNRIIHDEMGIKNG
jgi:hypothetical protein